MKTKIPPWLKIGSLYTTRSLFWYYEYNDVERNGGQILSIGEKIFSLNCIMTQFSLFNPKDLDFFFLYKNKIYRTIFSTNDDWIKSHILELSS